jgi:hypothetical protein
MPNTTLRQADKGTAFRMSDDLKSGFIEETKIWITDWMICP